MRDMTPQEMRRKGRGGALPMVAAGAARRCASPPASPIRFALTAADWGEPVPKTVAAARRFAQKGHRLLTAYAKARERRQAA